MISMEVNDDICKQTIEDRYWSAFNPLFTFETTFPTNYAYFIEHHGSTESRQG